MERYKICIAIILKKVPIIPIFQGPNSYIFLYFGEKIPILAPIFLTKYTGRPDMIESDRRVHPMNKRQLLKHKCFEFIVLVSL